MPMTGYTKLFNSILASTIWRADDQTRIVWITLLAMSDKHGVAEGSVPGLADLARVSIPDCQRALEALSSPDEWSRSQEQDGRRIEAVDGGWRLINHAKYRDKLSADERREYKTIKQREYRKREAVDTDVDTYSTGSQSGHIQHQHQHQKQKQEVQEQEHRLRRKNPRTLKKKTADDNFTVIVALIRKDLTRVKDDELVEATKLLCAQRRIAYNSRVVRKAVEAVIAAD